MENEITRRKFLSAAGLTVAGACLAPRNLFAEEDHLVKDAFREAATAKIRVQTLRRNVSVLLGPGGNIAVLTGPDGKSKLAGDVALDVREVAGWVAPNPGGVGPMTRAMLLTNVVERAEALLGSGK